MASPDVAVGDYHGDTVVVLPGIGDGTFRPGLRTALATAPRRFATADFNRDGHLDIAAACVKQSDSGPVSGAANEVLVLLGNGDGTFRTPERIRVPAAVWSIAAVDLDGDSIVDLAVGQPAKMLLIASGGDGTFRDARELATPVQGFGYGDDSAVIGIRSADLNNDDRPGGTAYSVIWILPGTGDGKFRVPLRAWTGPANNRLSVVIPGDFDGDGFTELAAPFDVPSDANGTVLLLSRRPTP